MKPRFPSEHGLWIAGCNPVKEVLSDRATVILEFVFTRTDHRTARLKAMAETRGIPVRRETDDTLTVMTGHFHHQGVAVLTDEFRYTPLDVFLRRPMEDRHPVLILDSIQDPQNLGALIRSACFLGAKGILTPRDRSARVTGTVIKVASGATVHLPVIQVVNIVQAAEELKQQGFWIVGLDVAGNVSLYETDLTPPLAIVVGNEQKGIRPLVRKHCDFLVTIPAGGPVQSLNAATAGAIALAEVQRQRLAAVR